MDNIDMATLKKYMKVAVMLNAELHDTKKDELDDITNEYIDKLLKTAGLNPSDFDIEPEDVWAYMIGFCYGVKSVKDTRIDEIGSNE